MTDTRGNPERLRYAREHGYDVMYAETQRTGYATWTYSDGQRVALPTFGSLEGLQYYARRHRFAVVYVN